MKKVPAAVVGLIAKLTVAAFATLVVRWLRPPAYDATEVTFGKATPKQESRDNLSLTQNPDNSESSAPAQELRRVEEYRIGRQLGSCLVRGCSVLLGTVHVVGEPAKEAGVDDQKAKIYRTVEVAVEEWIWGDRREPRIVIIHASPPLMSKTAIGPWSAWEGVEPKIGGKLLVALWGNNAERPMWRGKPQEIALAVSNDDLMRAVRECIALHTRLVRSEEELSNVSRLVRSKSDVLTAGYVLSYLIEAVSTRDVNKASLILSALQSNDQLPDIVRIDASAQLLGYFNRLSPPTRRTVAGSLVITASGDDVKSAESALSILVRLSDEGNLKLVPLLTAERRRKLARNYQPALGKGLIGKGYAAFESQLGLKSSR